jgi:CubicO group peptidase (beta-lactamase class C family)
MWALPSEKKYRLTFAKMNTRFIKYTGLLVLTALFIVSCTTRNNDIGEKLPRAIPESEGVDSKGVIEFLKAAGNSNHEFHSFMFLRHGKVVAEGWWSPYAPELKHTLYSTSKSFTSTAVGFAVSEKRLKLSDKVVSFFPDQLPDTVSRNLADMEIRDLLMMSAGQEPDPTFAVATGQSNWIKGFLATKVISDPGTKFLYNSMATYMLSAIVQKVTGEKVLDYLTPRLFKPLSIEGIDWETDPSGINTGGWGLRVRTEDLAKFGQFYLQKGKWNGKSLLPSKWIDEATTFKIDQAPGAPDSIRKKSDWVQGYCYQFWRCRNNAFRGDGAFGQYIIVMPEKDAVIAITCETADMQGEIDLVWKYLLPSLKENSLPADSASEKVLKNMLGSLAVKSPAPGVESLLQSGLSGKTWDLEKNEENIESVGLNFSSDTCVLKLAVQGQDYMFLLGKTGWLRAMTTRPGPNLFYRQKDYFKGMPAVPVAGRYVWTGEKRLELTLRYIESPHTEVLTCEFNGDKMTMGRKFSFMLANIGPDMTGRLRKK